MDDLRGLGDQIAHHGQLVGGALDGLILHRSNLQRQVLGLPLRIVRVVHLGRGQLQQVADAPGHHVAAAVDVAGLSRAAAQGLGDHGAQLRFFRNE
ncbi:hypothetical protein D9M71_717180 [compost metagenome]